MDRTVVDAVAGPVKSTHLISTGVSNIHEKDVVFSQSGGAGAEALPPSSVNQRAVGASNQLQSVVAVAPPMPADQYSDEDKVKPSKMTWHQKVTFLSATLATLADVTSFSIMSPFFPLEAEDRGLSSATVGFIFSIFSFTSFVVSPLFGKILPVAGARFLFLAGSFVAGTCNILFGLLDEMPTKETFVVYSLILRSFEGIGSAASITASSAIIAHTFPDNVGTASSLIEMMAGIGSMLGPALGGLLYSAGGFKLPFILLGGIDLLIVAVNFFLMPEHGSKHDKTGSLRQVLRIPAVWLIMICIFIGSMSMGFMDPTLSPHLKKLDFTIDEIGLVFLSYGALYGLSSILWGYIADKKKCTRIMIVMGFYGGAISFLLLGPSPYLNIPDSYNKALVITAVPIGSISMAMIIMPTFLDMLNSAEWYGIPNDFALNGIISGLWGAMFSLGSMFGPILGGFLNQGFGFGKATTVLGGCCILGMLLMCFFGVWEFRCGKGKRFPSSRATILDINSAEDEKKPLLEAMETNGD